jgi:serine/threonine protein kinase
MPYDQRIDIWSVGCIIAELWTGRVLFQNESVPTMLARMQGVLGPFDEAYLARGKLTHRFFTKSFQLYDKRSDGESLQ